MTRRHVAAPDEVFEYLDLPRAEHGPCNLVRLPAHEHLALEMLTVLKSHEDDPVALREHREGRSIATSHRCESHADPHGYGRSYDVEGGGFHGDRRPAVTSVGSDSESSSYWTGSSSESDPHRADSRAISPPIGPLRGIMPVAR